MVKKVKVMFILALTFLLVLPSFTFANNQPIKITIDGVSLQADQMPIIVNGRTLVPLRAIFEALGARVVYEPATKKITATRNNTTIVLHVGSDRAYVNNQLRVLDVPAQTVSGRTLVPVRFVSEALGDDVKYNAVAREVVITTSSNITVRDVNDFGDGRDLEVSFSRATDESKVDHYRIFVVKTSKASSFTLAQANQTHSSQYTYVAKDGKNIRRTLASNALDTDGLAVQSDISYTVFVLTVGRSGTANTLEKSNPITLTHRWNVPSVTGLSIVDASDYGDGRDIEVSFNRVPDENNLLQYRAIVVRSSEASSFTLSQALELPSSNYTILPKNGVNIRTILHSHTRDNQGRFIQSGIAYRVFILSEGISSRGYGSSLSPMSQDLILANNPQDIRVSNLIVNDVADFGDGRDLEVSFTTPRYETRVTEYRVMVVPSGEANNFTFDRANNIPSSGYNVVHKTGANISTTLPASARDVNGRLVEPNRTYRVFVLSVGGIANSYVNSLSTASSNISLVENFRTSAVTNVHVDDISNFNDGRDVQVTFNRATNEDRILEYRIIVVKAAQANGFTLASANAVPASNYTSVSKTGANLSKVLYSHSRDAFGEIIREGVDYRVFVLSVSRGGNHELNSLSAPSAVFNLTNSTALNVVTNVIAEDVGNAGDGSDLQVRFNKLANETSLLEYRIMVVRTANANTFDLTTANNVSSNNYTRVAKTGSNITQRLHSFSRDVHGNVIRPDESYRVFVLSVSNSGVERNTLSLPSNEITLTNPGVDSVTGVTVFDVSNFGNGQDLEVNFVKANNEAPISYYAVMVVRAHEVSSFNLAAANLIPAANFTRVNKTGNNIKVTLNSSARDVRGNLLTNGVAYHVFVLSVADGTNATVNALSTPSSQITLTNKTMSWSGFFQESSANNGTIATSVTATLSGDTFASQLEEGVHFTVANLPAGLSVNVTRSSNQAIFTLTGAAANHQPSDSITNLSIIFTNAAFAGGSSAGVTNSANSTIEIRFQ